MMRLSLEKTTTLCSQTLMVLAASVVFSFSAQAQYGNPMGDGHQASASASETPKELKDVKIEEKLGSTLPLNLTFKDETGKAVQLSDFFHQGKPVLISLVYFTCPGLCNFHLNGLTEALKAMDWTVGNQFTALAISFDATNTPEDAANKKTLYMNSYGRPEAAAGWHYLTADEQTIRTLTDAVGFKFSWNKDEQEWSHASTAIIANSNGLLTRYLPGIVFEPRDLKLALNESSQGKIGNFVESMVLYCFKYNPHQGKYTLAIFNVLKLAALMTILLMMIWMIPFWIRNRRLETSVRSAS